MTDSSDFTHRCAVITCNAHELREPLTGQTARVRSEAMSYAPKVNNAVLLR